MPKIWSDKAWDDYLSWQTEDRKTLKRINELIRDIERSGLAGGIGKPEALRYRNAWSRRIDHANRLIYNFDENKNLLIIACRGHYDE
jgi:toxin YoeB